MHHTVKIQKIGNSFMAAIPRNIVTTLKLHRGDVLVCEAVNGKVQYRSITKHVVGVSTTHENPDDRPADFAKGAE